VGNAGLVGGHVDAPAAFAAEVAVVVVDGAA